MWCLVIRVELVMISMADVINSMTLLMFRNLRVMMMMMVMVMMMRRRTADVISGWTLLLFRNLKRKK